MEDWEAQRIRDEEHLNMLGIFNFVFAGLCLLGTMAFIPHLVIMQSGALDRMFDKQWEKLEERSGQYEGEGGEKLPLTFDRDVGQAFRAGIKIFIVGFMLLTAIAGALCLYSGLGLRAHRRRTLSLVVAALQCFAMPVGTVLGVFTLVILGKRSVQAIYLDTEEPGWADEDDSIR